MAAVYSALALVQEGRTKVVLAEAEVPDMKVQNLGSDDVGNMHDDVQEVFSGHLVGGSGVPSSAN